MPVKEDVFPHERPLEKGLPLQESGVVGDPQGVQESRQDIRVVGRKPESPGLEEGRLVEDHRSLQVLAVTVPVVEVVVRMVLPEGLAVIAHNDQDRPFQKALFLQVLEDPLNHPVQQVQVVDIPPDQFPSFSTIRYSGP